MQKVNKFFWVLFMFPNFLFAQSKVNCVDSIGLKQGKWNYYYQDGSIKEIIVYLNDTIEGFKIEYDQSGIIKRSTFYNKGIKRWETRYNIEGMITAKSSFDKFEQPREVVYFDDDNGCPLKMYYYKNGILEGKSYELFNCKGKVCVTKMFKNGQIHGNTLRYDENSKLKEQYVYDNGKLIKVFIFNVDGVVISEKLYENEILIKETDYSDK